MWLEDSQTGQHKYNQRMAVAYQAPPSMGFAWQEYWSGLPLPSLSKVLENIKCSIHRVCFRTPV